MVRAGVLVQAAKSVTAYFDGEKAKMVTLSVTPAKVEGECSSYVFVKGLNRQRILWSWREELNLQPAVYKTAALPLSYASHRKVP